MGYVGLSSISLYVVSVYVVPSLPIINVINNYIEFTTNGTYCITLTRSLILRMSVIKIKQETRRQHIIKLASSQLIIEGFNETSNNVGVEMRKLLLLRYLSLGSPRE